MKIDKIETAQKMRGILLCKIYLYFWPITTGNFSFILFTFVGFFFFLIGKVIRLKFLDLFIHRTVAKYFALHFSVTPSFYSVLFFELIFLYKGRIILYFWRKYALAHTLYGVGLFCVLISERSCSKDIPRTLSRSRGSLLLQAMGEFLHKLMHLSYPRWQQVIRVQAIGSSIEFRLNANFFHVISCDEGFLFLFFFFFCQACKETRGCHCWCGGHMSYLLLLAWRDCANVASHCA